MTDWSAFPVADTAPPAAPQSADPWAQFPVANAPGASSDKTGYVDPFGDTRPVSDPNFDAAFNTPIGDMAASAGSGLVRGTVDTALSPITLGELAKKGVNAGLDRVENAGRWLVGADPISPELQATRDAPHTTPVLNPDTIPNAVADVNRGMNEALYKPRSVPGKFANTVASFVPGAIAGGGGGNLLATAVAPAVASETAGQLTEGSAAEPYARLIGAILGNTGVAAMSARTNATERAIVGATKDTPQPAFDAAQALIDRSRGPVNVPLTGPEAIQQQTGNATGLGRLMRVVEGAPAGNQTLGQLFAQRPAQVEGAIGRTLDTIAPTAQPMAGVVGPQLPDPSSLGPNAARVAGEVVDNTRGAINTATRPLYAAAEPQLIPRQDFVNALRTPGFRGAVQGIRTNADLPNDLRTAPARSIATVDAATKVMNARGAAAGQIPDGMAPLTGATLERGSTDIRTAARTAVPEYDQALAQQEALRRTQLEPLERGPVGQLAAAPDTNAAAAVLLPDTANAAPQLQRAVGQLVAQEPPNAPVVAPLVRQGIEQKAAKATSDLVGGPNQSAGANFAKVVAGQGPQEDNLMAVLRALPGGPRVQQGMQDLIDVLRATGKRLPVGSPTAEKQMIVDALSGGKGGLTGLLNSGLGSAKSLVTGASDASRRAWLGKNVETLAQLFADPQSARMIGDILQKGTSSPFFEAGLRTLLQTQGGR